MNAVLLFYHCEADTGYAIPTLECRFDEMAMELVGEPARIHRSYPSVPEDSSETPASRARGNVIEFDARGASSADLDRLGDYIAQHRIDFAFGFDAPVRLRCYRTMRSAGVERIVSYQGAPMSSINSGLKLLLKKLEVRLDPWKPDHFIFESRAMAESATRGRGIAPEDVSVVHLGIDPEKFRPSPTESDYLNRELGIPRGRKTVVFSGHMEERKGIDVLMRAARELHETRGRTDFHVLVLGNRGDQAEPYLDMVRDTDSRGHVTFGGYRDDVASIFRHCSVGVIPSTGWDSFTVSAVEMAASGLPLVVSDLQGLPETVAEGETGYTFPPGDHEALADRIEHLLDRPGVRKEMSDNARARVLEQFTKSRQVDRLVSVCRDVYQG